MVIVPVQPALEDSGWPCSLCPSTYATVTLLQSTGVSSVTVTVNWTVCPKENGSPGPGVVVSSTTGAVLPTMISTDAAAERPVRSVTRSVASNAPFSV